MDTSSPSTTSLLSSNTVTSTTPLTATPQKDYFSAFGVLQSRYGTSGQVPSHSAKSTAGGMRTSGASAAPKTLVSAGTHDATALAQQPRPNVHFSNMPSTTHHNAIEQGLGSAPAKIKPSNGLRDTSSDDPHSAQGHDQKQSRLSAMKRIFRRRRQ